VKKIKLAKKQLDRALADMERAANNLDDAGFTPQAHLLDEAGGPVEKLRDTLAAL
jgi:hypothetical protein